jgi:hypothetical protein
VVSRITELARSTINRGEDDLDEGPLPNGHVRRKGGGGRPLSERDPTLVEDLRRLVEPVTLGSPVKPLPCVSKSSETLVRALIETAKRGSSGQRALQAFDDANAEARRLFDVRDNSRPSWALAVMPRPNGSLIAWCRWQE